MFDFLNKPTSPLAERARSPLYSSFVISWIVWNWRVILTVFLFEREDYNGLNIVQYIAATYLNMRDCIWIPLAMAAGYIVLIPWIDYFIIWYTEYNKRVKIDKKIAIGRKHYVEGSMYYDLRIKYEEERKALFKYEEDIRKVNSDLAVANATIVERNSQIQELNKLRVQTETMNTHLSRRGDVSSLRGRWNFSMVTETGIKSSSSIEIKSDEILFITTGTNTAEKTYKLDLIDYDYTNRSLNFLKIKNKERIICKLRIISNNRLEGTEDASSVTYLKDEVLYPIVDGSDIPV